MNLVPRRVLLSFLTIVPLLAYGTQSQAGMTADASDFVRHLVIAALNAHNANTSEVDRVRSFKQLLMQDFDIPRISRFALGNHWTAATDEDRQQFLDTVSEFIIRSYAAHFSNYAVEIVEVTGARIESDNFVIVASRIVQPKGEPPIRISWHIHKGDDGFKVFDIDIEGISLLLALREEFAALMQRSGGTVAGLTHAIQQKINGDASARHRNRTPQQHSDPSGRRAHDLINERAE